MYFGPSFNFYKVTSQTPLICVIHSRISLFSMLTFPAGRVPSPHLLDPKLTIPTAIPFLTTALPLSPLQLSLPISTAVQNILGLMLFQKVEHSDRVVSGLSTEYNISGSRPESVRPQPAMSTLGPSTQVVQHSRSHAEGKGIGVTCGNPSIGVPGYVGMEISPRENF